MDGRLLKSQFYLIASIDNPALKPDNFDAVCAKLSVQCVLIEDNAAVNAEAEKARNIVSNIQSRGIAVLFTNQADKAYGLGADGVHLDVEQDIKRGFDRVQARLGKKAIIGTEVGNSRHDAMERAEKNAAYIAFSGPDDEMAVMIAWWADLFEIPSVAWRLSDPETAGICAKAGADFIAIDLSALSQVLGLKENNTIEALAEKLAAFQTAIDNVAPLPA